jgi:DNA-directed RNA polymerase specialized sigma24 family protein
MTDDPRWRFEQAYAAHHAAVLGYALRRAGSADDAAAEFIIRPSAIPAFARRGAGLR